VDQKEKNNTLPHCLLMLLVQHGSVTAVPCTTSVMGYSGWCRNSM